MLTKIDFNSLNTRQKENYNFHKVAAKLAEYGYHSMRLSDDWEGADFIALHVDGLTIIRVQLKGRGITFAKKYIGKNIHIAFRNGEDYYLYPHDALLEILEHRFAKSRNWIVEGKKFWNWRKVNNDLLELIEQYRLV